MPDRHNIGVFCVFLGISTVLWLAMTVNVEVQKDVRCRLKIKNAPDTLTELVPPPPYITVFMRGAGTAMPWMGFGEQKDIDIDFAVYQHNGVISLNNMELRNLISRRFGNDVTISMINPDSLHIEYTSRPPVQLPLYVDSRVTTQPNFVLTGPARAASDSVLVYSRNALPDSVRSVTTAAIQLNNLSKTTRARVPVKVPRGCRAVPDSVDVTFYVEPMISRSVQVPVKAINVPDGIRLILLPNTVKVNYMLPMSKYNSRSGEHFTVVADYKSLDGNYSQKRIKISVVGNRDNYINVYTTTDSVDYIIERDRTF